MEPTRVPKKYLSLVSLSLAVAVSMILAAPTFALSKTTSDRLIERGLLNYDKGDIGKALADFNRAIELDAKNSTVVYGRSMVRFSAVGYEAYREDYTRGTELDRLINTTPKSLSAHILRGLARLHSRPDLVDALSDLDHALEINPELARSHIDRALKRDARAFGQAYSRAGRSRIR